MDPIRLITTLFDTVSDLSGPFAYATIVGILLVCGLGVPIPEDITLLAAGLLASDESITVSGALVAGFSGVLLGDAFLFFMGRKYGKKVFRLPGLRQLFTEDRVAAAEARIRRNGPFICFVARFLPGLRSPIFAMSGALGVRPATFFLLDGLAAMISVPVWVYLGYWFGNNLDEALKRAKHIESYLFTSIALLVTAYFLYQIFKKRREKRRLAGAETLASIAPAVAELQESERVGNRHS